MLTITLLVLLALSLAGNALHLPAVRTRLGIDPPNPATTGTTSDSNPSGSTGSTAASTTDTVTYGPVPTESRYTEGRYSDPYNPWAKP